MIRIAFALFLAAAGPAAATQEYILPTLFDVAGVAADDVLNIRAEPNARSEIIGTFAPDARRIEVTAHDASGRWGQVNTDGQSGWASMHYLAYRTDVWEDGKVPPTLHCAGTEPFWSLAPEGDRLTYSAPDQAEIDLPLVGVLSSGMFRDPRQALIGVGEDARLTAVIVPVACSDGMSNRAYGLDATVIIERGDERRMQVGCCSIAP